MYQLGASYSAINTAKAAPLTNVTVNGHNDCNNDVAVVRFFKGLFNYEHLRRNTSHLECQHVFHYLDQFHPLEEISLQELSLKYLLLAALSSGSRAQTLHYMYLSKAVSTGEDITFFFTRPS